MADQQYTLIEKPVFVAKRITAIDVNEADASFIVRFDDDTQYEGVGDIGSIGFAVGDYFVRVDEPVSLTYAINIDGFNYVTQQRFEELFEAVPEEPEPPVEDEEEV